MEVQCKLGSVQVKHDSNIHSNEKGYAQESREKKLIPSGNEMSKDTESDKDLIDCEESIISNELEKHTTGTGEVLFENDSREENLIQFWSPTVKAKLEKVKSCERKKSRFQPKRKLTSNKIDYSDKKKKKRKSVRLLRRKPGKDIKKTRVSGVSRKSGIDKKAIQKLRRQSQKSASHTQKNLKLAILSGGYLPVRSKKVTKPKEFKFSNRIKEKVVQLKNEKSGIQKDFESGLRGEVTRKTFKNQCTQPVPFNFQLSQKVNQETNKWESVAEATLKFQVKTPTRFHVKPSGEYDTLNETDLMKKDLEITMPVTPKLLTRGRSRRYKVESAQELEDKIVEEMHNYRFKAKALNPKIIEKNGMYGVKSVPASDCTELKPFQFEIEQRISNRTLKDSTIEETNIDIDKSRNISKVSLKPTQPKPFSFYDADKKRYQEKEERIKEQILAEKKLHEFHSTGLPSFSPDALPIVSSKKRTLPKPFNISTGSLSYQSKLEMTMKMDEVDQLAKRQFKGQSADVINKAPFQPILGQIPPTKIKSFSLSTDTRADEREMQQFWKKEKENMLEEERLRLEEENKLKEQAEVKKLRKQAVHKAKPVPNFKPLEIKKSQIPLTVPETPDFQMKKRAKCRLEKVQEEGN